MNELTDYEQTLLSGWEEVYKKGQLTLWIFLALKEGPKHMAAIGEFIESSSNHTLSADKQSLYRALRKFDKSKMVSYSTKPGSGGPDLKEYALTSIGLNVLNLFIERNITTVFFTTEMKKLLIESKES